MRALCIPALLAMLLSQTPARSQAVVAPKPIASAAAPQDTLTAKPRIASAPEDSLLVKSKAIGKDSAAVRPKSRSDSVIVVKHSFNHREQIITGSVIMTCLAVMLVAMNNYNPR